MPTNHHLVADARRYIQENAADLGGDRYEAEFDYWKKGSAG
jgi:hypothetical protein